MIDIFRVTYIRSYANEKYDLPLRNGKTNKNLTSLSEVD